MRDRQTGSDSGKVSLALALLGDLCESSAASAVKLILAVKTWMHPQKVNVACRSIRRLAAEPGENGPP